MGEAEPGLVTEVHINKRVPSEWAIGALAQEFVDAGETDEIEARAAAERIMREYENVAQSPHWGPARALASFRSQLRAYETLRAHENEA